MKRYFIILILPILSIFAAVTMYFSWFQGWLYFYLKHVMATVSHMGYITIGITAILLYFVAVQLVNWKINKALLVFATLFISVFFFVYYSEKLPTHKDFQVILLGLLIHFYQVIYVSLS